MIKCTHCGRCCREEVCKVGLDIIPDAVAPCPFLTGNNFCLVIIKADEEDEGFGAHMRFVIGIGVGCDSSININDPINEGVEL